MTRFPQMRAGLFLERDALPAQTCDEMRKAIFEGMRESSIIHNAMMAADYNGMSGENRYTLLAYHALIALETHFQAHLRLTNLLPTVRDIPHIDVPPIYPRKGES